MKTKRKFYVVVCLCLCLMAVSPSGVVKAKEQETAKPYWTSIYEYNAELVISDKGMASVKGYVVGRSSVTSTYVKVSLQKKSGNTWVEVESWEDTCESRRLSVSKTYQVSHGTYRVVATVKADSESETAISESRSY